MRKVILLAAMGMMLMGVGCTDHKSATTQDTMKMSDTKDDCPFCPGVQHANPDGTCPVCGMKVKG